MLMASNVLAWAIELCTSCHPVRHRPWRSYGPRGHNQTASHGRVSGRPPPAESRCICSSYTTSKRLLQLLSHLPAHTCHRYAHNCHQQAREKSGVVRGKKRTSRIRFGRAQLTSRQHHRHQQQNVEACVQILGLGGFGASCPSAFTTASILPSALYP